MIKKTGGKFAKDFVFSINLSKEEIMNRTSRILFATLAFSLIAAASAKSGPCCHNPSKECTAVKTGASPNKDCSLKKPGDSIDTANAANITVPDKTILFFMNPNGRPCQAQLGILNRMKEKLAPLAAITYIKTTENDDRDKFSKYGIRGLPSLIIVDKNGREISRFQPGIQDEASILRALGQKAR